MKHPVYMNDGSIVNNYSNTLIERPAILIDKSDDCLCGWGELDAVKARFDKMISACSRTGFREMADDLVLIELSEYRITREMACYVIRRALEYTATGFLTNLYRELVREDADPFEWLTKEMARIPMDLTEPNWT